MSSVQLDLGKLPRLTAAVRHAALAVLADIGEFIVEESQRIVPFDEGDLADSARSAVSLDTLGNPTVAVSYDTPYALAQHENETYTHAPGRTDHYLSKTVEANRARIDAFLAAGLKRI